MHANHWKAHNNMYLDPVVAAQQVLDPSFQTSHPRKERKEGEHIRCNQIFQHLTGCRYMSTSSGYLVGSFIFLLLSPASSRRPWSGDYKMPSVRVCASVHLFVMLSVQILTLF